MPPTKLSVSLASMRRSRMAWIYLWLVALTWLLGEVSAERTLPTLLLAYAPPLLWLLPAPLVLLWAFFKRSGRRIALLATLLALWSAGFLHWRPQQAGELRVLTYNALSGKNTTPAQLATHLQQADAEVILLQEAHFTPTFREALVVSMRGYAVQQAAEVMTFTRLPLLASNSVPLPAIRREVLITRVAWHGQPLTVVNAHLGTVQVLDALAGEWVYLSHTSQARQQQVQVLEQIAQQSATAVLLGGDLNTPPRGQIDRRLQRAFGPDAHDQAGRGPGWTFPSLKLRIDHLMARGLTPTHTQVMPAWGSDHRALLAEYRSE